MIGCLLLNNSPIVLAFICTIWIFKFGFKIASVKRLICVKSGLTLRFQSVNLTFQNIRKEASFIPKMLYRQLVLRQPEGFSESSRTMHALLTCQMNKSTKEKQKTQEMVLLLQTLCSVQCTLQLKRPIACSSDPLVASCQTDMLTLV